MLFQEIYKFVNAPRTPEKIKAVVSFPFTKFNRLPPPALLKGVLDEEVIISSFDMVTIDLLGLNSRQRDHEEHVRKICFVQKVNIILESQGEKIVFIADLVGSSDRYQVSFSLIFLCLLVFNVPLDFLADSGLDPSLVEPF